jgi:hypothetical protein
MKVVLGLIAMGVVLYVGMWQAYEVMDLAPPCESFFGGVQTGPQKYEGHDIYCFHGDVVKVRRGRP